MFSSITGVPAYGRDYKSKAAVLADWQAGKDFRDALSGQYFNKDSGLSTVWVRYDNMRKQVRVTNK